jgi:RHS repeat-associated protein
MSGYVTGDHNRLLSDGTYSYTYDEEGNRVTRTHLVTGDVDTYTWDHRNRLVSVVTTDVLDDETQRVEFVYDAFDRRVEKRADTDADGLWNTYERFVYDGEHIALVFDEAGSLTNRYLHGPAIDQILADEQLTSGLLAPGDVVWPLTDHLGTVRHLADSAGNIINDRVYDSFGQLLSETNPSVTHRFGFTGREWDAELGLNYHRARYYDVGVGRWISEDPIGFTAGDANLGRYVGNFVTSAVDASGTIDQPAFWEGAIRLFEAQGISPWLLEYARDRHVRITVGGVEPKYWWITNTIYIPAGNVFVAKCERIGNKKAFQPGDLNWSGDLVANEAFHAFIANSGPSWYKRIFHSQLQYRGDDWTVGTMTSMAEEAASEMIGNVVSQLVLGNSIPTYEEIIDGGKDHPWYEYITPMHNDPDEFWGKDPRSRLPMSESLYYGTLYILDHGPYGACDNNRFDRRNGPTMYDLKRHFGLRYRSDWSKAEVERFANEGDRLWPTD